MRYFERLRHFWFPDTASIAWFFLGLPALYFWQTLIHEGAHAVTALFATGEFPKLYPFPHVDPVAGFRNGVAFTGEGFIATPQFLALLLIIVFTTVALLVPVRNRTLRFLLRFWFFGACVDLMYNTVKGLWGGSGPFSDWGKLTADVGQAGIIVLTWVIWLIILSHFLWVYYSPWSQEETNPAGFWGFRWVALVCGILSLLAILFGTLVSDPRLDKGHPVFIVALVGHILALLFCGVYFGVSYTQE
jgi:hypothetical protein